MGKFVAYELRADDRKSFAGGSVARHDGSTLDLAEALKEGKGRILVPEEDAATVSLLDSVDALKRAKSARKTDTKDGE